ncbi:UDP-glucose 4-epimerase GalE [Microbacterium sp. NPDC019599]|uniref:UDP-glucose 4-epimerase GalE n=1 Tax=Microbacterium sp. NPDC019599 TaxID=3154690 RepID=UPI003401F55D
MRIALYGGAGYIGSHVAVSLLERGHDVLVVDDLSNSHAEAVARVEQLAGRAVALCDSDARDRSAVSDFLGRAGPVDALILLAGLKSVEESLRRPALYYDVNVGVALAGLAVARDLGISRIVFSSSATVYGDSDRLPLRETDVTGLGISSPYGRTKWVVEQLLRDEASANPELRTVSLRYFNPIGAHESGLLGENPRSAPTNLLPIVARVAFGALPHLSVFGTDYPTPDGTALRDYIDVNDLADAHLCAVTDGDKGFEAVNVGTGRPVSVYEMVASFERATSTRVPIRLAGRRPGDVAASYADPTRAYEKWGWRAVNDLEKSCRNYWAWQTMNAPGDSTLRAPT